jgi:hypothetical protein
MRLPGFIGPTYVAASHAAAAERCVNLFPEVIEAPGERPVRAILRSKPGLVVHTTLPDVPVRALFYHFTGRCFAVAGQGFYEIFQDQTWQQRGSVGTVASAQMATNGPQIIVVCGSRGYIFDIGTGGFTEITADGWVGAVNVGCIDGYFLTADIGSRNWRISGLLDGLSWDPLEFAVKEGGPDPIVALVCDHREAWLMGSNTIEVWWNAGAADFPFQRIQGVFIELGCAAPLSAVRVDNSVVWLGQDERGNGMVWRAESYAPKRISNHAIEAAIKSYPRIDDAVAYRYQDDGHTFYVLSFPTANATWVFDFSNGLWHERAYWDLGIGQYTADRARTHCFAWGKHLVGDREDGRVYWQTTTAYDDAGAPMRRLRQAPNVNNELKWITYQQFELFMQTGTVQSGQNPLVILQNSNDGGFTWGNEMQAEAGSIGDYQRRVEWRRLGRSRNRAFRVIIDAPVPVFLLDAFVELKAEG